jgi:uncharacterized protein YcbK (DUF882 family)
VLALALGFLAVSAVGPADAPSKKTQFLAAKAQFAPERPAATETVKVVYGRNLHTEEAPEGIPPVLIERILVAAHTFESRHVRIVSGFRHPKYNTMLRKKGREVAKNSQHTLGHAVDFNLAGVSVKELYSWLLRTHKGGVGVYRHSGFVHIDTGRKRTWSGS